MPKRIVLPLLALLLSGCIRPGNDEVLVTPYTKIDFQSNVRQKQRIPCATYGYYKRIAELEVYS